MEVAPHVRAASTLQKIPSWCLAALVALIPIVIIPTSWASLSQAKMLLVVALVIAATLAWLLACIRHGSFTLPRSALIYAVLLLPIAYAASAGFTGWPSHSLIGSGVEQDTLGAVILWTALFILAGLATTTNHLFPVTALRALAVGLTVLFAFQIAHISAPQLLSLGGLLPAATNNLFGSWHDLGIIAGLALFLVGALWRTPYFAGVWRILLAAMGILSIVLLIVIHFSDVLFAVAALSIVAAVVSVRVNLKNEERGIGVALQHASPWIVCAVVLAVLAFFAPQLSELLPGPFSIADVEVRPSWQGTFDIARQSLEDPASYVFGSGPNTFERRWGMYKPTDVNTTPFWNTDFGAGVGSIPTSLFSSGIFGLIAWAAIACVLIGLSVRFLREMRPLISGRLLFGVFLAASLYLVVFHVLYTPGIAMTALMFVVLGLLAGITTREPHTVRIGIDSLHNLAASVVIIIATIIVLISAGLLGREIVSNLYVNRGAIVYAEANDTARASQFFSQALEISPDNDRAHRAAAELGLIELARLARSSNPADQNAMAQLQNTLQMTLQHGLGAVAIDSENYQNWLSLAFIYGSLAGANVEGAYEAAQEAYEKAAAASPQNPLPRLRMAQLALARSDRAAAREHLDAALALKPDFAMAYFLKSQLEADEGNAEAALNAAVATAQLVPNEPLAWFRLGSLLYGTRDFGNARGALEQAVSLQESYADAIFILALTYRELGETEAALRALVRVQELDPDATWVAQVSENIRNGKDPFAGTPQQ